LVKGQPKITGAKEPTPLWNQTRASQRVCDFLRHRPHDSAIEYNLSVPRLTGYYGFNHAHFLTTSTYRRVRVFDSEPFRDLWVCALGKVRSALRFKLIGYVLMPEHFHLLFWSGPELNPSGIVRSLKVRTAMEILKFLREHPTQPWCRQTLNALRLPPTVHSPATHRVWQRR
jgi:REP element-mobilizing transposase RayT